MTSEECVEHAEECEFFARLAKLEANKRALLESAAMWRQLAESGNATGDGAGTRPTLDTGRIKP
jgi:hypothetical protein